MTATPTELRTALAIAVCNANAEIPSDRCHCVTPCAGAHNNVAAIRETLVAAGYKIVPLDPEMEMLQDGRSSYRSTNCSGVSGMTLEAQVRAECAREAACYAAMLAVFPDPLTEEPTDG